MGIFRVGISPISITSVEPSSCDKWLKLVPSYPLTYSRLDFTTAKSFPHALPRNEVSLYLISVLPVCYQRRYFEFSRKNDRYTSFHFWASCSKQRSKHLLENTTKYL